MKVTATVARMRRAGIDVVDFGAGEPDFPTPDAVKRAAHAAIDANFTKYTPNAGIADLKRAICDRYGADYGVAYDESQVIVTAGGKQALYDTALALFGPGDEVVTHAPYWPTIPEQIKLADAVPVLVETRPEDGFAIRAEALLNRVTPRTRGILVNSPANPTGAVIAEDEFERLAAGAAERGLWLVLDLCYEKLMYDGRPHNLPAILARQCPETSVICGSTSKAYAMTGWRCGWAIGPAEVIKACDALQSHATSNVASITQKAALEAIGGPQNVVAAMLNEYRARRDQLHGWLTADPHIRCVKPSGAFYLFPDIREAIAAIGLRSSVEFAEALLEDQRVAVTPGEAFGAPGFVRLSYAASLETLREGSRRILEFVRCPRPSR